MEAMARGALIMSLFSRRLLFGPVSAPVAPMAAMVASVLLGACQAEHLVDPSLSDPDGAPGRSVALTSSPSSIEDTIEVGTGEVSVHPVSIGADGASEIDWSGRSRRGSDWLRLDPASGTAPQEVSALLDGGNLSEGTHVDTLLFEPESESARVASIPVVLLVRSSDGGDGGGGNDGTGGDGGGGDDATPEPPAVPTDRGQFESDETTRIPVGGTAASTTIVVKATVQDPDPDASVRIEVELAPVGTAFLGLDTRESTSVADGEVASIRVENLLPLTAYHWRIRAVDETDRKSSWTSFGGNGELDADFRTP